MAYENAIKELEQHSLEQFEETKNRAANMRELAKIFREVADIAEKEADRLTGWMAANPPAKRRPGRPPKLAAAPVKRRKTKRKGK